MGSGNNFGPVTLNLTGATNNGAINYVENGTVAIAGVTVANTAYTGAMSITSLTGNITQSGAIGASGNALAAANFSAATGTVTLNSSNYIGGAIGLTATSSGTNGITDAVNMSLGNISVSGTGTVTNATTFSTVGVASRTISEASGSSIWIYGPVSFQTQGGAVTVAQAGNNFGGITVNTINTSAAGANASIRETGQNSYISVTTGTGGTFTAKDDTAGISETSAGSMTIGGTSTFTAATTISLTGAGTNSFTGATSFTSSGGATTVSGAFNGGAITLATTGNASVTDTSGTTVLSDSSNVSGNLTVTNATAGGVIKDNASGAAFTVGGTAAFNATGTGASQVLITGSNNLFGTLSLQIGTGNGTGTGTSAVYENTNMNLLTGSIIGGGLTLNVYGNFTTSGNSNQVINFDNASGQALRINANGSITVSNPLFLSSAASTFTVDAVAGPTNLIFLSKANNLDGVTVSNLGNSSNYTPPNN